MSQRLHWGMFPDADTQPMPVPLLIEPAISGPHRRTFHITHGLSFIAGLVVGASVVAGCLCLGLLVTRALPF